MKKNNHPKTPNLELIANSALLLAMLVFIGGAASYYRSKDSQATSNTTSEAGSQLQERQQAIEEAKKNGQKDYSFSSGFNPGIGGQ